MSYKVPQEIWNSYIVEKFRRENPHLNFCRDESEHIVGGAIVYIPQAGALPSVVKNRAFGAQVAVERNDTMVMYGLNVFTTNPTGITVKDKMEISYNKQDSIFSSHTDALAETVGDEILYDWMRGFKPAANGATTVEFLPASNMIPTKGVDKNVNSKDGQTGTRKAMTEGVVQEMQAAFNKDNVPVKDRYAMLESYMYQEFLNSLSQNQAAAFAGTADLTNGVVGKFAGFTFLERSSVLALTAAGVFRLPGEAIGATDNLASIFWQKNSVAKALGSTELFQDIGNPLYYADLLSGLVKMGGRCVREDWKGLGLVVQAF